MAPSRSFYTGIVLGIEVMSTIFTWKREDFWDLLESCDKCDTTPFILKYLRQHGIIIEAGCGLGRFVRYLSDKGYNIQGIEYSLETVRMVKEIMPDLDVIQGDVANMPYPANSIDGIISLGVVEHFIDGPVKPLKEMYRVLKLGRVAIITVPSFNLIRKIKKNLYVDELNHFLNPLAIIKRSNIIRKLLKKNFKSFPYNRHRATSYNIYPTFGEFFEYRFTKEEFEDILVKAGYTIIESVPIAHMDGVYHEFGRLFVSFKNWHFFPNIIGRLLNSLLSRIRFCHNHMHLCVVRKKVAGSK